MEGPMIVRQIAVGDMYSETTGCGSLSITPTITNP